MKINRREAMTAAIGAVVGAVHENQYEPKYYHAEFVALPASADEWRIVNLPTIEKGSRFYWVNNDGKSVLLKPGMTVTDRCGKKYKVT